MITFLALVVLIAVFIACLKFVAEFGDKRAEAHLQHLRDATPPHEYFNHDGTKGRWP